jgi:hypothetical protein
MLGTPVSIIRTDDAVDELREARLEAAEQARQAEQGLMAAEGAKVMSETPLGENSALDAVLGGITGASP